MPPSKPLSPSASLSFAPPVDSASQQALSPQVPDRSPTPPPPPPRQARRAPLQSRLQSLLVKEAGGTPADVEEIPLQVRGGLARWAPARAGDLRAPAMPEASGSSLPPPPAEEVAAPPLRHRASINTRLRRAVGAEPLQPPERPDHNAPALRHHDPEHRVATLDGAGFALTAGRLFSWNNGTGSWDRMPQRDIDAIRLGADGHAYARLADKRLLCLTGPADAVPAQAGPVFAVSPTGRIASLAGAGDQARIRLTAPPPAPQAEHTLPPPPPRPTGAAAAAAAHALAFGGDGSLHLLTDGGDVWRLAANDVANGQTTPAAWRPLSKAPGAPTTSLLTLPNGAVAAGDESGDSRFLLEKNDTWTAHADATESGLERTYGQFRSSQQRFTNVTLGSPITPGAARSDKKDVGFLASKLAVLRPEQSIQVVPRGVAPLSLIGQTTERAGRYLNYFVAHYFPGPAPHAPQQPLQAQLRQEYQALLSLPLATPTPPATRRPPLSQEMRDAMDANASMALDRLERALGIRDAQGVRKTDWRKSAAVVAAKTKRGAAATDDNMLHLLLRRRQAMLAADADVGPTFAETTLRLQALVAAGVHLQRPLSPNPTRVAMGYLALPPQLWDGGADLARGLGKPANQGLDILAGHLVKDQLCYETALLRAEPSAAPADADLRRLRGGDGDLVSQRFKQNIWDARSEVVFDSMRAIMAAFGDPDHVLNRAARFQGVLGEDKEHDYMRLVDELPPGESLRFEYTVQGGVDGDGLSHNFNLSDRFKEGWHPKVDTPAELKGRLNIPMNVTPNILPVPAASLARTRAMTISKRAYGIDITFSQAFEAEVKLASAKFKWGAGEYGANKVADSKGKESHTALGLAFMGLELVGAGLVFSKGRENSVKLSLNNDDAGTVGQVVRRLLSGACTPEELITHTAEASYTRANHSKFSNTLDLQALVAFVGIFTSPDLLTVRYKKVLAFVEQWTAGLNFSKSDSRTQDASGVSTTTKGYESSVGLNRKFISVTEAQLSWTLALSALSTFLGKTQDIEVGDGYELEGKVPTWIDLQIMELFAPKAWHRTPSVQQSADGTVTGLRYVVSSKNGLNFEALPQWEELARHSPEIAANLRGAADKARAQGLPVDVEMELVPECLVMMDRARRIGDDDLARAVSAVMRDPSNWRIKQLRVGGGEQYSTALVAGFALGRYRSHAGNSHQSNAALIDIRYAEHGGHAATPAGATVRGRLTNGGGQPRFNQLDTLAGDKFHERVYGVSEERRDGPRRRLAALPSHGPSAVELADLSGKWLRAPRPEPHLALDQGRPVLQFQLPDRHWQHVALDQEEIGRLLDGRRAEGSDTVALLQLMQAGASGRLDVPPGSWAQLRDAPDRALTQPRAAQPHAGRPSEEALGVASLLADANQLQLAIWGRRLDPAQRHVLRTFFGPDWESDCVAFARDPAMVAALDHALRQLVDEAPVGSAGHDTPQVEVLVAPQSAAAMMPSTTTAS